MSKRHTVTLHHVMTVYNDMFNHIDSMMRTFGKKQTPWKEDLFVAVKFAREMLSKFYTELTPTPGMLLSSAHILYPFRKLRSDRKWDIGMDINPENETFYTTQYQEAILMYVETEYCAKHPRVPVNKHAGLPSSNLIPSATASRSCQSIFDPYDLSSDYEDYLMADNVADTTPG